MVKSVSEPEAEYWLSGRPDILERARQVKLSPGVLLLTRGTRRFGRHLSGGGGVNGHSHCRLLSRGVTRPRSKESQPYLKETMRNLDAAIALTLLDTLENNIHARREGVSGYREFLKENPRLALASRIALDPHV